MIFVKGEIVRVLSESFLDISVKEYAKKIGIICKVTSLESTAPYIVGFPSASVLITAIFTPKEIELVTAYDTEEEIKRFRDEFRMLKM